ncbi:MAG TPA: CDGSH iron-sulfur domain-containing protein [Pseudolabrys sp.]
MKPGSRRRAGEQHEGSGNRRPRPDCGRSRAGKIYWWCACGRSKHQPFCDGSHKVSTFELIEYRAEKNGKAFFCRCKRSAKKPLCDGSHKKR